MLKSIVKITVLTAFDGGLCVENQTASGSRNHPEKRVFITDTQAVYPMIQTGFPSKGTHSSRRANISWSGGRFHRKPTTVRNTSCASTSTRNATMSLNPAPLAPAPTLVLPPPFQCNPFLSEFVRRAFPAPPSVLVLFTLLSSWPPASFEERPLSLPISKPFASAFVVERERSMTSQHRRRQALSAGARASKSRTRSISARGQAKVPRTKKSSFVAGVSPALSKAVSSAPHRNSRSTTNSRPRVFLRQASCNGVCPSFLEVLTPAPCRKRASIASRLSNSTATDSGVRPMVVLSSMFAPASISASIASASSLSAA
ncbi:unnamed protein product [Ectocarpus sp. 8 AP-2014]